MDKKEKLYNLKELDDSEKLSKSELKKWYEKHIKDKYKNSNIKEKIEIYIKK